MYACISSSVKHDVLGCKSTEIIYKVHMQYITQNCMGCKQQKLNPQWLKAREFDCQAWGADGSRGSIISEPYSIFSAFSLYSSQEWTPFSSRLSSWQASRLVSSSSKNHVLSNHQKLAIIPHLGNDPPQPILRILSLGTVKYPLYETYPYSRDDHIISYIHKDIAVPLTPKETRQYKGSLGPI